MLVALLALFVALGGPAQARRLINGADIKKGTVRSTQIKDHTIALRDISPSVVRRLLTAPPNSIVESMLVDGAVTAAKLGNGAVTGSKLGDNSVTSTKVADGSLTAADVARCGVVRSLERAIDEPGVIGLLPSTEDPITRLLVTDDRAYDALASVLPDARAGAINVFAAAARCMELVERLTGWTPEATTALIRRDLETVPAVPLPSELRLRPVRRLPEDPPGGVPLEDAAAAAVLADPRIDDQPALVGYLRSLPAATRLFAAIDGDGVVRATSGCGAYGTVASVMFINTDRDWRGRGIGRAMTAAALRAAQEHGARDACLDATDAGLSTYQRLGFQVVTRTTRFFNAR